MKNKYLSANKFLILFLLLIFLVLPLHFSFASLPSREANSIFKELQQKTVDIHFESRTVHPYPYEPREEAVIVIIKSVINKNLSHLNFVQLPREFLVMALARGGKAVISMAVGDPTEFIMSELASKGIDGVINSLKDRGIEVNEGKIDISYTDIGGKTRSETLFYSVVKNRTTNRVSASFYSKKGFFVPNSVGGPEPYNFIWRDHEFEEEKLNPFLTTFSGTIRETSTGVFRFEGDVELDIEFFSEEEIEKIRKKIEDLVPEQPSLVERIGDFGSGISDAASGFVFETGEFFRDSWQAMLGFDFFGGLFPSEEKTAVELEGVVREDTSDAKEEKEVVEEEKEEEDTRPLDDVREKKDQEKEKDLPEVEKEPKRVEINSALGEKLETLSGIGPVYAERIIENRPFCSLDDLMEISGIGETTLGNIKDQGLAYVDPPGNCFEEEEVDEELIAQFKEIWERMKKLSERVEEERKEDKEDEKEEEKEDKDEKEEDEIEEVEINSASGENLELLQGIGPTLAERIIGGRPFCSLSDLTKVSGIGDTTLEGIKDQGLAYVDPPDSCFRNGTTPSPPEKEKEEEEDEKEDDEEKKEDDEDDEEEKEAAKVEINSADKENLLEIVHIGDSRADEIMEKRPFCGINELIEIGGISSGRLSDIKDQGLAYVDPPDSCFEEEPADFEIEISGAETIWNAGLLAEDVDASGAQMENYTQVIVNGAETLLKETLEENV